LFSQKKAITWDCGYAKSDSRMQYTASSFAQFLVGIFNWVLKSKIFFAFNGNHFPVTGKMHSHVDEIVLDRALIPAAKSINKRLSRLYLFQQGQTQQYILYVLIGLFLMLITLIPFKDIIMRIFN